VPTVDVRITDRDRRVGAMVKALAVEVSGFQCVKGTTREFLQNCGYCRFTLPNGHRAQEFRVLVKRCLAALAVALPEERPYWPAETRFLARPLCAGGLIASILLPFQTESL
jgi:hypothetical protein